MSEKLLRMAKTYSLDRGDPWFTETADIKRYNYDSVNEELITESKQVTRSGRISGLMKSVYQKEFLVTTPSALRFFYGYQNGIMEIMINGRIVRKEEIGPSPLSWEFLSTRYEIILPVGYSTVTISYAKLTDKVSDDDKAWFYDFEIVPIENNSIPANLSVDSINTSLRDPETKREIVFDYYSAENAGMYKGMELTKRLGFNDTVIGLLTSVKLNDAPFQPEYTRATNNTFLYALNPPVGRHTIDYYVTPILGELHGEVPQKIFSEQFNVVDDVVVTARLTAINNDPAINSFDVFGYNGDYTPTYAEGYYQFEFTLNRPLKPEETITASETTEYTTNPHSCVVVGNKAYVRVYVYSSYWYANDITGINLRVIDTRIGASYPIGSHQYYRTSLLAGVYNGVRIDPYFGAGLITPNLDNTQIFDGNHDFLLMTPHELLPNDVITIYRKLDGINETPITFDMSSAYDLAAIKWNEYLAPKTSVCSAIVLVTVTRGGVVNDVANFSYQWYPNPNTGTHDLFDVL